MIRRHGTYETEVQKRMRGGEGQVKIEHLWRGGELQNRARLLARLTLEPGSSIGFHEHRHEAEVFLVIRGRARMMDQEQEVVLAPGDSILTSECGHSVESVGDQPLEMLAVILTPSAS